MVKNQTPFADASRDLWYEEETENGLLIQKVCGPVMGVRTVALKGNQYVAIEVQDERHVSQWRHVDLVHAPEASFANDEVLAGIMYGILSTYLWTIKKEN